VLLSWIDVLDGRFDEVLVGSVMECDLFCNVCMREKMVHIRLFCGRGQGKLSWAWP
jgi:hypothetical protein